jgi:hypothetical protein
MKDYQFYKDIFDERIAIAMEEGGFSEEAAIKLAIADTWVMIEDVNSNNMNLVQKLKNSVSK